MPFLLQFYDIHRVCVCVCILGKLQTLDVLLRNLKAGNHRSVSTE